MWPFRARPEPVTLAQVQALLAAELAKRPPLPKISDALLAQMRSKKRETRNANNIADIPYKIPQIAPGVLPDGVKVAQDSGAFNPEMLAWAAASLYGTYAEGLSFMGYPYLSELAQRPEYRRISETIATQMTRKWIELQSVGDTVPIIAKQRAEKIEKLTTAIDRYRVRDVFREAAEQDGFFGRSHIFLDIKGSVADKDELKTPIGNGSDKISTRKVREGSLQGIRTVEAAWAYPSGYDSNDPLKLGWYKSSSWYVMGTDVHASRLLTFIGREVPDMLKPSYAFGGLSLTQMAKPYVDNWLQTRQSVADIIKAFSVFVLKTNMQAYLQMGGTQLDQRVDLFNYGRDNRGLMMVDKDTEDFMNVAAPITGLSDLQAQTQEHIAAVVGIPLVFLLGISPHGLNASSEGEIRVFYDWIASYQELLFRRNLTKVINFIQLSEFGEVDDKITFRFVPLWSLDELQEATLRKTNADTDAVLIEAGTISVEESRKRVANDPGSPYQGMDESEVPEPPQGPDDMLGGAEELPFGEEPEAAAPPSNGAGKTSLSDFTGKNPFKTPAPTPKGGGVQ